MKKRNTVFKDTKVRINEGREDFSRRLNCISLNQTFLCSVFVSDNASSRFHQGGRDLVKEIQRARGRRKNFVMDPISNRLAHLKGNETEWKCFIPNSMLCCYYHFLLLFLLFYYFYFVFLISIFIFYFYFMFTFYFHILLLVFISIFIFYFCVLFSFFFFLFLFILLF